MLLAGETSGDTLGAELVKSLIEADPQINCIGAGGSRMENAGVDIQIDLTQHAVIGVWEAVQNYGKFKKFFNQLLSTAEQCRPDAIVLIDNPGFNLRFAAALRDLAQEHIGQWRPRIIQYISPQIWAWHESRVHCIARDVDLLLSIFPFEKEWYAERVPHLDVEFVGHPLVDRHPNPIRRSFNAPPNVLILPGSREKEITRHLPTIVSAVAQLTKENNVTVTIVLPNDGLVSLSKSIIPNDSKYDVHAGNLAEALLNADVAIASSGTVTMECAWFRIPTVVLYKTSWPTYMLGRFFIKIPHIAMPNVLAGREIFPEYIQSRATANNLTLAAARFLKEPMARETVCKDLDKVVGTLGKKGAASRAAQAIIAQMDKPMHL